MPRQLLTAVTLAAAIPTALAGDSEQRHQAVSDLGRLNGVALHCKYLDQVRVMKAAVVENAPKQRSYGQAFDAGTNEAFLEHIQSANPCPGHAGFTEQVNTAISKLQQVFAEP